MTPTPEDSRDRLIDVLLEEHYMEDRDIDLYEGVLAKLQNQGSIMRRQAVKRANRLQWVVNVAAIMLCVLSAAISYYVVQSKRTVATVTNLVDATWSGSEQPTLGTSLRPGKLILETGGLYLTMTQGATLSVEAPAEIELLGKNRARLLRGKARAFVPEDAKGFVLETPGLDVVDLGTEFGAHVVDNKETEVHLFRGEVHLEPLAERSLIQGKQVLKDSGALRLKKDKDAIPVFSDKFLKFDPYSVERRRKRETRFSRWQDAFAAIREDDSFLGYIDFNAPLTRETADGTTEQLLSFHAANGASLALKTHGIDLVPGRWQQQRSAIFNTPGAFIDVPPLGEHDVITMMAWIKCQEGSDFDLTLYRHRSTHASTALDINIEQGRQYVRIQGYDPKSVEHKGYEMAPGEWYQVALVVDQKNHRFDFYINGRFDHQGIWQPMTQDPIALGWAQMGFLPTGDENETPAPKAIGIDSWFVFSRALSVDDIGHWFKLGNPRR